MSTATFELPTHENDLREYEKSMYYDMQNMLSKNPQLNQLLIYVESCNHLLAVNAAWFRFFAINQKYIEEPQVRQELQNLIERLAMLCQKARERLQENNVLNISNEKVLYSSLALKTLIENLLDKSFMEQVGANDSLLDINELNIVAFGKGIDEAIKDLS